MARGKARRKGSGNRRIAVMLVLLGGLTAALFATGMGGGADETDDGDTVEAALTSDEPTPRIQPIDAYKVVYKVDSRAGGEQVITTDEYWFRRPWDSVWTDYRGAPPGTKRLTRRVSSYLRFSTQSERAPFVVEATPWVPSSDMRLDATLDDLVRRGLVVPGEAKQVDGRRCTVLITYEPILGSPNEPPTERNQAENCVDRHGIVLQERWTLDGKLTRIRTATELDTSPSFTDADFAVAGVPLDPKDGGNVIRPLTEPDTGMPSVTVPERFGAPRLYRYLVGTPPRQGAPVIPPIRTLQVWQDGTDIIVLEHGQPATDGTSGLPTSMGEVTVEGLADAGVHVNVYGSEVFGHTDGDGMIVRLRGTMSTGRLLDIARTLRK